jgi:hypothetical protein
MSREACTPAPAGGAGAGREAFIFGILSVLRIENVRIRKNEVV